MASLLFTALPLRGHVHPMVPLALACVEAGHDVRFRLPRDYVGTVPLPSWDGGVVGGDVDAVRAHRDADQMGLARAVLGDAGAGRAAARLAAGLLRRPVGLVVHDATDVGAAIAADLAGVASVSFDVGHWSPVAADRAVIEPLPSPLRVAAPPDVPVLELRSVAWADGGEAPSPGRRPRVYVTFGTLTPGGEALTGVRGALAGLEVDVVEGVDRYVDQTAVLAACDVAVHHGGTGTMLGAIEHGVAQVVLPRGADQHLNARRLHELGAAVVEPASLRDAVTGLLDPGAPQHEVAAGLRDELRAMPAPADVVPMLEAFVS